MQPSSSAMPAADPFCPHLSACPGCPRFGDFAVPAPAAQRLRAFAEGLGVEDFGLVAAPQTRYRHRARLAVRGRAGRPKLGLFQTGTHQVVDIPNCAVHHPHINLLGGIVKRLLAEERLAPYSDAAHAGLVRYLQLVVERASGRIQLVVVANSPTSSPLQGLFNRLQREAGDLLHSVFFNGQTAPTNAILGPVWEHVFGPACVVDTIGGAQVFFPPGAFGQASPDLFDSIVERVHSWVPVDQHVTELYAGVGAIGLGLVRRSAEVHFNERSPEGLHGLQLGLTQLGANFAAKTRILPGAAEDAVSDLGRDTTVIVDPPRRGLDASLLEKLTDGGLRRLIYVSCGLDSFLRDAERLVTRYRCRALYGYALFPFTDHVETVACFEPAAFSG
jgi:23S rRNA (uracil1939-C5)-methyltransferase